MKQYIFLLLIISISLFAEEANNKYSIEKENFMGMENSWRVKMGNLEFVIPTEIGPRILHFSKIGKPNLFRVIEDQIQNRSAPNWQNFGGHRLWRAPEDRTLTYSPENSKVSIEDNQDYIRISKLDALNSLLKEIEIYPNGENSVRVIHRLTNKSKTDTRVSAWALTVLPLAGKAFLPLTKRGLHSENLLATDSIHLWTYTDMSDPIFFWGKDFIVMQKKENSNLPQKIGVGGEKLWAAYVLDDQLFIKKYSITATRSYPDRNSRVEVFINKKFLELETLSPLFRLKEKESVTHTEIWSLYTLPSNTLSNEEIVKYVKEALGER
ncbi:MAG TPA: hypothetical protein PLX69_05445 [Leptospiraceae bacterium]|nr:hypothetical protein [Leptospiraceae bacterium]HRG73982.1 hypothetical protein [Leptospiraceae bacterium]